MDFVNILAEVAISTIGKIENVIELDWLGKIIQSLIEGCNSIGLGIIVFTLILKLITLPFDIISRVSTKKSSVMMEKMRPELERLQRQYANNKDLYQRKMQDLYKKNGYSPFSASLPTLFNLVFFIVVIGQFSTYSNYANFGVFCDMSVAYETAIQQFNETNEEGLDYLIFKPILDINGNEIGQNKTLDLAVFYNSKHGEKVRSFGFEFNQDTWELTMPNNIEANQTAMALLYNELESRQNGAFNVYVTGEVQNVITKTENGDGSVTYAFENSETVETFKTRAGEELLNYYGTKFVNEYVKEAGRQAAAEKYRSIDYSFLWVKNIWSQDIPWEHPVKEDFSQYNFVKKSGCIDSCSARCNGEDLTISSVTEAQYDELTAGLTEEKSQANGYLILVVLSIGTMLLQQFIMQKQNKTQTQLGTVDGENGTAAQSQKMMTWMMPLMFGVFSFMYTASFSIYIVMSSLFSLASNLIINKLVDKRFEKLAKIEAEKEELKRTGRIKELEERKNKNKKK